MDSYHTISCASRSRVRPGRSPCCSLGQRRRNHSLYPLAAPPGITLPAARGYFTVDRIKSAWSLDACNILSRYLSLSLEFSLNLSSDSLASHRSVGSCFCRHWPQANHRDHGSFRSLPRAEHCVSAHATLPLFFQACSIAGGPKFTLGCSLMRH